MKKIRIINSSRDNKLIGDNIELTRTFFDSLIGLMGRRRLAEGGGLLLLPCSSIHTCWMRMTIDAVYLDKKKRVIAVDNSLHPWRIGTIKLRTHSVLELASGAASLLGIEVGDELKIEEQATSIA